MAVTITNLLVSGPLTIPLATGRAVRLGPGEQSPELPDAEVTGNAKVDKLRSRRLIEVVTVSDASEGSAVEAPAEPLAAANPAEPSRRRKGA
ncbi:hypothetical protein [Nocardia sp. NPDC050710]|uniref:hypothetical protein n=1 Tax=Nocardia sp. NPDC050710 TaxID=3157220 RepID=UPI0033F99D87